MERKLTAILAADVVGYSRLMEADEAGTLAALKSHREALIDPEIAQHHGRIVKLMGDGALVEFASVVDAVACGVAIQDGMPARNEGVPEERRIAFRIGVHLGDVMVEDDDLYGDGVNVAARLEGLAEPGGICISQQALDQIETKLDLAYEDLGEQQVKNIARSIHAYAVRPAQAADLQIPSGAPAVMNQEIRFCTAPDGVQIAYSSVGDGPPLVKTANWLNHLEYDWESPVWRHVLHALAEENQLIRYDQRGNGLSDWEVEDISFEAWLRDTEVVVDTIGLERFAILGISQGCSAAVAYAVRHPERVSKLVLYGGYLRGRNHRGAPDQVAQDEAMIELIKVGWGQQNPAFRQVFTSLLLPEGTPEQMDWFNELQRLTTTPENAARIRTAQNDINVDDMAHQVRAPTLVIHVRDDSVVPFEEGRRIAARIPGARLLALEGHNHLMLANEPSWPRFRDEMRAFLREHDD